MKLTDEAISFLGSFSVFLVLFGATKLFGVEVGIGLLGFCIIYVMMAAFTVIDRHIAMDRAAKMKDS